MKFSNKIAIFELYAMFAWRNAPLPSLQLATYSIRSFIRSSMLPAYQLCGDVLVISMYSSIHLLLFLNTSPACIATWKTVLSSILMDDDDDVDGGCASIAAIVIMKLALDLRLNFMMWVYTECLGYRWECIPFQPFHGLSVFVAVVFVSFFRVNSRIKSLHGNQGMKSFEA